MTACGSTPRKTFTIPRRTTSWRPSPDRSARRPEGRATLLVAENEPQHTRSGPARRTREALASMPCGTTTSTTVPMCALTGAQRGLLHRLSRRAAGVHFRGQVRISLPGPMVPLAEQAPRHAGLRFAAGGVRQLHPKPRPDGQLHPRRTLPRTEQPGCYRAMTALLLLGAGHPDALPGPGIRFLDGRFYYFADLSPGERARRVAPGRANFLSQFPSMRDCRRSRLAWPIRPTRRPFERCKLDFSERATHAGHVRHAPRPVAAAAQGPRHRPAAGAGRGRSGPGPRGLRAAVSSERPATTAC